MNEKDNKSRPRLGKKAIALVSQYVSDGETITGAHLEKAIGELERQAEEGRPVSGSLSEDKLRHEFDLLHRDLVKEIDLLKDSLEPQLKAIGASLDAIRIMLNIFGEELGGADTSDLFKEAHAVMETVLRPLAMDVRERGEMPIKTLPDERDEISHDSCARDDEMVTHEDEDLEVDGHSVIQEQNRLGHDQPRDQGRGR